MDGIFHSTYNLTQTFCTCTVQAFFLQTKKFYVQKYKSNIGIEFDLSFQFQFKRYFDLKLTNIRCTLWIHFNILNFRLFWSDCLSLLEKICKFSVPFGNDTSVIFHCVLSVIKARCMPLLILPSLKLSSPFPLTISGTPVCHNFTLLSLGTSYHVA